MDDTPISALIQLLQSKTMINEQYARELQNYLDIFETWKIQPSPETLNEAQTFIVQSLAACDVLDVLLQQTAQALQKALDTKVKPP